MDLFEHVHVVSRNTMSLIGQSNRGVSGASVSEDTKEEDKCLVTLLGLCAQPRTHELTAKTAQS